MDVLAINPIIVILAILVISTIISVAQYKSRVGLDPVMFFFAMFLLFLGIVILFAVYPLIDSKDPTIFNMGLGMIGVVFFAISTAAMFIFENKSSKEIKDINKRLEDIQGRLPNSINKPDQEINRARLPLPEPATPKPVKKGMKNYRELFFSIGVIAFNLIFFFFGAFIWYYINISPEITFCNPEVVRNLANTGITVSAILLATILGLATIAATVSKEDPLKLSLDRVAILSLVPIAGIITGLFSLYFSYFVSSFNGSKNLLGLSMLFTIVSLSLLFSIFAWKSKMFFKICN